MTLPRLSLLALVLACGQAIAAPNAQLVASVQQRLDRLGFAEVDAGTLSTQQIAELHLLLRRRPPVVGAPLLKRRQQVQAILGFYAR